jgi:chromosomal replication initiation ATPase DnaA
VVLNPVRAGVVREPGAYPWSSYRATAGLTAPPGWLTVDWVLEQFGHRTGAAQAKYREFVVEGIRQPVRPWEQVVGQVYLGGEAFIRRVQRHGTARCSEAEIPRAQREPCWRTPDAVLREVAAHYGVPVADLVRPTRRPSEARQVALYGLRRWAGESLPAIARRMGLTYSAVSRRVSLVERRLAADRRWRARLADLSDVKVKT